MGKRNADKDTTHHSESPHKRSRYESIAAVVEQSPTIEQEFVLTKELVDGTILTDICQKDWIVGKPIGE